MATEAPPRRRLRFSMPTMAWLLTTVALSIGLYQTGKQTAPLRAALGRLRAEMGYFTVDDESLAYARRVAVKTPNAWQWRLYLPRTRTFKVRWFVGRATDPALVGADQWFALLRQQSGGSADLEPGEFSMEALIAEYDQRQWLRVGRLADQGETIALPAEAEWLADATTWVVASDASYDEVRSFDPTRPLVLLHLERNIRSLPEGERSQAGKVGERLVVWIESEALP